MLIPNVFRPWRFATSVNGDAARQDLWAGRIERCLAAHMTVKARYALNKVVGFSPCKWTARFREEEPRPLFPQVERGVELDEGHASLPRASALRARFPLPVRVNRGWRCVSFDAAVCARISVGGCRGFARGRVPASSGCICQLNSGPRFALKAGHSHCLQSASSSSCWSSLSTPSSR